MADHGPVPSDRQLVDATRAGSDGAWRELVRRHAAAVHAVAAATGRPAPARTAHAAWRRVHREILGEIAGREGPVRAVRARALAAIVDGTYAPVGSDGPLPAPMVTGAGVPTVVPDDRSGGVDAPSAGAPAPTRAELERIAAAFGSLPDDWQTVLWHSWVDLEPAAVVASHLGRSVAATRALAVVADAGLCEAFLAAEPAAGIRPSCRDIVPLLGGARRSTLSATHGRIVEAHLRGQTRHAAPTPCADCGRRLRIVDNLAALVPRAVVPGVTGLDVTRYRSLVGAGPDAIGADALTEQRTQRVSQLTRLGAVAAVVVALLAAAFFIRVPDLQRRIADLAEPRDRIELHFPGVPQGLLREADGATPDVGLELSAPAPVFAGGTGTVDAAITNNNGTDPAAVDFEIRPSAGLSFDRITEGPASCRRVGETDAACVLQLDPGETESFSFRFTTAADVGSRLVVVPSIRSATLEVPVELVPDLVVAQVGRSDLLLVGNRLGRCTAADAGCSDGRRESSSDVLELPTGAAVETAHLMWDGGGTGWAREVTVEVPGDGSEVTVTAQHGLGGTSTPSGVDPVGFASIADVTDLVRTARGGRYTVTRRAGARGAGTWSLVVVTDDSSQPRRLVVVTRPVVGVEPDLSATTAVPLDGTDPPRVGSVRSLILRLRAAGSLGEHAVTVDGGAVGGADPFRLAGHPSGVAAYDLDIENSPLIIEASSADGAVRVSVVGFAVDVVS